MADLPRTAELLIEQLDRQYPQRTPRPGQTLDRIMFDAGQRSVVDALIARRDQEDEE